MEITNYARSAGHFKSRGDQCHRGGDNPWSIGQRKQIIAGSVFECKWGKKNCLFERWKQNKLECRHPAKVKQKENLTKNAKQFLSSAISCTTAPLE